MEKIQILDKRFKLFIKNSDLMTAVDYVAQKLNSDYASCDEPPIMLCILNGSLMFTSEVMQRIDFDTELATMKVSSYSGTKSNGKLEVIMAPTSDVKGRDVIIVEDIVDTGLTIFETKKELYRLGAHEVKVCTMLYKPEKFEACKEQAYKENGEEYIEPEYVAMEIPNDFIVGFGLDYDNLGRNYKDIYVLDE